MATLAHAFLAPVISKPSLLPRGKHSVSKTSAPGGRATLDRQIRRVEPLRWTPHAHSRASARSLGWGVRASLSTEEGWNEDDDAKVWHARLDRLLLGRLCTERGKHRCRNLSWWACLVVGRHAHPHNATRDGTRLASEHVWAHPVKLKSKDQACCERTSRGGSNGEASVWRAHECEGGAEVVGYDGAQPVLCRDSSQAQPFGKLAHASELAAEWQGHRQGQFRPFDGAREYVWTLELASQKEWNKWCASGERPHDIPSAPHRTYREE
eukprot:3084721-Pyramimonas_sp.AAC.1